MPSRTTSQCGAAAHTEEARSKKRCFSDTEEEEWQPTDAPLDSGPVRETRPEEEPQDDIQRPAHLASATDTPRAAPSSMQQASTGYGVATPTGYITCKVIDHSWMEALAAGEKLVEFQRYSSESGNFLRSVLAGTLVLFGPTKTKGQPLHAIGVTAEDPRFDCRRADIKTALQLVPPHLRDPLSTYLAPAVRFDYVRFGYVFDVREKHLSIHEFCERFGAQATVNQGFTGVKTSVPNTATRILRWCLDEKLPIRKPWTPESDAPDTKVRARRRPSQQDPTTSPKRARSEKPTDDTELASNDDHKALEQIRFPHLLSAEARNASYALQTFVRTHAGNGAEVRCLEVGGAGYCLFHSVAASLEALLQHSSEARGHVLQKVPMSVFANGKRAIVQHLRHLAARQLACWSWLDILNYCMQGCMRQSFNDWPDQWSPETLLRRNQFGPILGADTVRALGADPAGGLSDIILSIDCTVAEPGAGERADHVVHVTDGEVHQPILLGELQELFATTGNVHWGDATDARLLCDALDLGLFMFADKLQANGTHCLCALDLLRGDFPFFINLWWNEPVHFRAAEFQDTGATDFRMCYAQQEVPHLLRTQYNIANSRVPVSQQAVPM